VVICAVNRFVCCDIVDMELLWLLHDVAHNMYTAMGKRRCLPALCIVQGTFSWPRYSMVLVCIPGFYVDF